jgi:hypothetical protein
MKLRPIPDDEQLPDGVYIGLKEARYFAVDAMGSSDFKTLWQSKEGWWWSSRHNPYYRRKASDPLDFGSGLHCKGLEGPEAFAARYAVAPDPRSFPGLITTVPEIFSALRAAPGAPENISPRSKKADLIELAKVYCPDRPIWDVIEQQAQRKAGDRTVLSCEANWQIDVMIKAALKDETMRAVCTAEGGVRLTEVSVFWTLPSGTRMRFRFDSLLPAANADLKSLDNYRTGDTLTDAIGKAIGNGSMDIQAALSFTARRELYRFIEQGAVFFDLEPLVGDPAEQAAWLARYPAEAPLDAGDGPGWRWLWMFFQKPDNTGRAPTLVPVWMNFGGLRHRDGFRKAAHALAFYEAKRAELGLEQPWTGVRAPHFIDDSAAPEAELEIRIPSWLEQPMAVDGEQEELAWA